MCNDYKDDKTRNVFDETPNFDCTERFFFFFEI